VLRFQASVATTHVRVAAVRNTKSATARERTCPRLRSLVTPAEPDEPAGRVIAKLAQNETVSILKRIRGGAPVGRGPHWRSSLLGNFPTQDRALRRTHAFTGALRAANRACSCAKRACNSRR
jgi:hypothetical protein